MATIRRLFAALAIRLAALRVPAGKGGAAPPQQAFKRRCV